MSHDGAVRRLSASPLDYAAGSASRCAAPPTPALHSLASSARDPRPSSRPARNAPCSLSPNVHATTLPVPLHLPPPPSNSLFHMSLPDCPSRSSSRAAHTSAASPALP